MFALQLSLALFELQIRYLEDTCTTAKPQLKELEDARDAEQTTSGKGKERELE